MTNPNFRRFPLTYDEEFDSDIHRVISTTPVRRRSERIRELIRLGLAAESSDGVSIVRSVKAVNVTPQVLVDEQVGGANTQESNPPSEKVRKRVSFNPPS